MYVDVAEIPIREILEKYASINKEEKEKDGFKCLCPLHNDNTPSFKVYEKDNTFYCFGCTKAGGPVDLVRMLLKLGSNDEAAAVLEKEYDIEQDAIPSVEGLCSRKGLSVRVVTEKLGWQDVSDGVLIPYLGAHPGQQGNNYPTYKIRTSYTGKGGKPKYIKDGKNIVIPYGLNMLSHYDISKPLYITEGETDMITMLQAGYQVLGIPGANSFKKEWASFLEPYATICVVIDNDQAGDNMLKTIINAMGELSAKVFFKPMPNGIKDVNTLHCTTCHKDIDLFVREFEKIGQVPATLKGFEILKELLPELDLITQYNIVNYIRHIIGDNKIEIDKFVQTMYDLQGKRLGISKTTIKDIARSTVGAMIQESEEANEVLALGLGDKLITEGDDRILVPTCYCEPELVSNHLLHSRLK